MNIEIEREKIAKKRNRIGAYILDSILLAIVAAPVNYLNIAYTKSFWIYLLLTLGLLLYKPLLEHYYGATVGKFALDIKVTDTRLENISLIQSFKRSSILMIAPALSIPIYFLAFNNQALVDASFMEFAQGLEVLYPIQKVLTYASVAILIVDVIMMFTDHKKLLRSLHDRIGETLVINAK